MILTRGTAVSPYPYMLCLDIIGSRLSFLAKIFNSKKVQVSSRNRNSKGPYFSWWDWSAYSSSCLISTLSVKELMKGAHGWSLNANMLIVAKERVLSCNMAKAKMTPVRESIFKTWAQLLGIRASYLLIYARFIEWIGWYHSSTHKCRFSQKVSPRNRMYSNRYL